jgi:ssDNA-binding Zn-finger/Zn-ribbon topoisomerase 1
MRQRTGSRGPFWGCAEYPACRHTAPIRATAPDALPSADGLPDGLRAGAPIEFVVSCASCGALNLVRGAVEPA